MSHTLNSTGLSLSTASNTANSSSFINQKDFPRFMNFLQTHRNWPNINSQISKVETKKPWTMTIKQEPITIVNDRSVEEEKTQEQQNDLEKQFSVGLSLTDCGWHDLHPVNGEQIYDFAQQLQALTYRQLLEDEKQFQLPVWLSKELFIVHFEISIKPRNNQILDCLANDLANTVSVTEFTFMYSQLKATESDFEYVSKTICSFPALKSLTLNIQFGYNNREDRDFSSLIQSFSQLKQLKQLTLELAYQLNYSRLNLFFQAISQLPQLSILKIAIFNCNLSQMDQPFNLIGLNNLSKLSTFSLYLSDNKMCNKGANSLMKELTKLTNSISCLSLTMNYCDLNDQSAAYLGQAISQLKQLQQLQLLLAVNKITSSGMQQILEAINNNPSSLISDLCLELTENSYENEGVISIASSLQGLPRTISKLEIYLPTEDIKVSGVEALSEALLSLVNLIDFTVIFLQQESDASIYTDDGRDYKDSVEKQAYLGIFKQIRKLTNLRRFSLRNNYQPQASEDHIKRSIIKKCPRLVSLNLS